MHTVRGWTARRWSPEITIIGKDCSDQVVKIAHVVSIEAGAGCAIATDVNGTRYQLLCDGTFGLTDIAPADVVNAVAA